MADNDQTDLTTLTVELLSAYFANNLVPSENLSGLIQSTYSALAGIDAPAPAEAEAPKFTPAVSVRKSLASRDHIISMIDGKAYRTLKRHLTANGLSPAEYRERYKLPASYPMVAPAFSDERRAVAAKHGLGGSKKRTGTVPPSTVEAVSTADPAEDAAVATQAAGSEPAHAKAVALPPKATRKARADSAKPAAAKVKASKAGRQSVVDGLRGDPAADDQDVGENVPTPTQTSSPEPSASGTPLKPRRKLKIRAGEPADPDGIAKDAVKAGPAAKPRKAKAVDADQSKTSDAPKPAKRAYKKRASKTAPA